MSDNRFAQSQGKPRNGGGGNGDVAEHRQPPSKLPGQRRFSLRENEEQGGHILEKHVGKSVEQLRQRLTDEEHLKVASSFKDEHTAQQVVSAALEKNQAAIDEWLKRPLKPLRLTHEGASELGIALNRGASTARPSNVARLVLQSDSRGGFYVLTAYLD